MYLTEKGYQYLESSLDLLTRECSEGMKAKTRQEMQIVLGRVGAALGIVKVNMNKEIYPDSPDIA